MTVEEAIGKARQVGIENCHCLMNAMRSSGGTGKAIKAEVEKETKRWASALIQAQIDILHQTIRDPMDEICHGTKIAELELVLAELVEEKEPHQQQTQYEPLDWRLEFAAKEEHRLILNRNDAARAREKNQTPNQIDGKQGRPSHCPTCNSPDPSLHPAMQFEGSEKNQ